MEEEDEQVENISNSNSEEHPDSILRRLPVEVILRIFSYLPKQDLTMRVSLVNKAFQSICLDSSLWTSLRLPTYPYLDTESAIALIRRCTKLKELDMSRRTKGSWKDGYKGTADIREIMNSLHDTSPKLESLTVSEGSEIMYSTVYNSSSYLKKLKISLNPLLRVETVKNLFNLTSLTLGHSSYVELQEEVMSAIGQHCTKLTALDIGDCIASDRAVEILLEQVKGKLKAITLGKSLDCKSHVNNTYLSLSQCRLLEDVRICFGRRMVLSGLEAITSLPELHTLHLSHCIALRSKDYTEAFSSIRKKENHLKKLQFVACPLVDDNVFRELADDFPELRHLFLCKNQKVTDEGLRCFLQKSIKLQRLDLIECSKLTHMAFVADTNDSAMKEISESTTASPTPETVAAEATARTARSTATASTTTVPKGTTAITTTVPKETTAISAIAATTSAATATVAAETTTTEKEATTTLIPVVSSLRELRSYQAISHEDLRKIYKMMPNLVVMSALYPLHFLDNEYSATDGFSCGRWRRFR